MQKPVTENTQNQHRLNCVSSAPSAVWWSQGKGGGRTHRPSLLPQSWENKAHEVKVLVEVTQQLASSALVQAWVYPPCSFYHTNVFWLESGQGHFIRTPGTQPQVNLQAQVSVLSFGPRGLNYLKSRHSTVKLKTKRTFAAMSISFLQLCQWLYSKTTNNKPTDPHLLCEKLV